MKKLLSTLLNMSAFCIVYGYTLCCAAQTPPIAGGYAKVSKTDKSVITAANFAVKTEAKEIASLKLIAVDSAERQVVAGSNYRMCLSVSSAGKTRQATAVVYQNLQNKFSLTEWKDGKCGGAAQTSGAGGAQTIAPDSVVKNLYAAQKADKSPFFQKTNRALVDKYFTKDFADLIWGDATSATDGVGAIDFDPLFNAQDVQIADFKIGKPEYGEGNAQLADVPVTFKNMGNKETVLFRLEQDARKTWKISEIYYPKSEDADNNSLKTMLKRAASGTQ